MGQENREEWLVPRTRTARHTGTSNGLKLWRQACGWTFVPLEAVPLDDRADFPKRVHAELVGAVAAVFERVA